MKASGVNPRFEKASGVRGSETGTSGVAGAGGALPAKTLPGGMF
jgi:hypothetical protein